MIPSIENIVEMLVAGKISKSEAVSWLHQHAEDAYRTLLDEFATAALTGIIAARGLMWNAPTIDMPSEAYRLANEMLDARLKVKEPQPPHVPEG